jgi:hypothetical protein
MSVPSCDCVNGRQRLDENRDSQTDRLRRVEHDTQATIVRAGVTDPDTITPSSPEARACTSERMTSCGFSVE